MSEDIQPTPPAPLESGQRETPKIYEACLNWEGTGNYSKRLVAFENYQELKRELAEAKAVNERNDAEWATLMADVHDYFKDERADRGYGRVRLVLTLLDQMRCDRDDLRDDLARVTAEKDLLDAELGNAQANLFRVRKERDAARAELPKEAFESNIAILQLRAQLADKADEVHKLTEMLAVERALLATHPAQRTQPSV